VSRENKMMLRACLDPKGTFSKFVLSSYSGGGDFYLWMHRLDDRFLCWVVDAGGLDRTLLCNLVLDGIWDFTDLDEIGLEILRLNSTNGLTIRDSELRHQYEALTGHELPARLERPAALASVFGG
jgi:hypothetical protein